MEWWTLVLLGVVGWTAASCSPAEGAHRTGANVVDSIRSREEELLRFRSGLPAVSKLQDGSATREGLFEELVGALGRRDTTALAALVVSQAEFAYLYYPTAPQGLPPYGLEPSLMWHLLVQRSDRGIRRALSVYGGQRFRLLGHDCGQQASREGPNTVWGPCLLHATNARGDTVALAVVSQIIERGGRYKVLSYANKL